MATKMADRNFKLTYFDVKSLAEPIRWIFHYHNIPFEDIRIEWDYPKWFEQYKKNYLSTVGQIPVLQFDNGKVLCQSQAISRYLAKELNFDGDNNWENAVADEVLSLMFDLFHGWRSTMFSINEETRIFLKKRYDDKFPLYYTKFSKILEQSDGDYVCGKKLTYADFWLASFLDVFEGPLGDRYTPKMPWGLPDIGNEAYKTGLAAQFPKLVEHRARIMNLPGIREWIAKRPNSAV